MTTLILLPLCMLKSFAPLAPFSILGILGTMFTAGVLALRLVDGSYAPGGKFYQVRLRAFVRGSSLAMQSTPRPCMPSRASTNKDRHIDSSPHIPHIPNTHTPTHVQSIAANLRPELTQGTALMGPMVFVLVSMLSTSFIAHYNAPKFYQASKRALDTAGTQAHTHKQSY